MFEMNPQQQQAVKLAKEWWNSHTKQVFEITGPAGSGKTTIIEELLTEIGIARDEVLFMAFIGKAAMVLSMKGHNAKTIHSSIYDKTDVPRLDDDGNIIEKNGRPVTYPSFTRKEALDKKIKLLIVDEGGTVDKKIGADIISFGLPTIVLGDLNQLPPIFGKSYFLEKPDVVLTQVMRQNEGDPIIHLSQKLLKGERIPFGKYGDSEVIAHDEITHDYLSSADMIICGRNSTRENINRYVRETVHGRPIGIPVVGDKIVCRQNNWRLSIPDNIYLINGMVGTITHIYLETYNKKSICIDFKPDFVNDSRVFTKIKVDFEQLFAPVDSDSQKMSFFNRFQFAHAITAHMSQGSQYESVLAYREHFGGPQSLLRRIEYVMATRATKVLRIAQEKRKLF